MQLNFSAQTAVLPQEHEDWTKHSHELRPCERIMFLFRLAEKLNILMSHWERRNSIETSYQLWIFYHGKESLPSPMSAPRRASLAEPKPSSLHTTLAAVRSHRWSHTDPHFPSRSTSTRPSPSLGPAFRRTAACGEPRKSHVTELRHLI